MVALGRTDLDVYPINLGGNVFGWSADEPVSRTVLDAYAGTDTEANRPRLKVGGPGAK